MGGAAGLAGAAAINSKPGTPVAPLEPGVTRPDSNMRSETNGQTAAQIAAANPTGNVFVQNTPTAARNPGKLPLGNLLFCMIICSHPHASSSEQHATPQLLSWQMHMPGHLIVCPAD